MASDGTQPKRGDLIEIHRFYFTHWAIYVGKGYVVHLAPASGMAGARVNSSTSMVGDRAIVKKELLSVVAGGDKYQVNNRHDDKYEPLPPNKIIQRAEEILGKEILYSVTPDNCEHFVNELRYGVSHSDQGGTQLKVGDLIEMYGSYFAHWAIYVGEGYVVHLVPASEVAGAGMSSIMSVVGNKAIVKKELLSLVTIGYKYRVNNKHDDKYKPLPPYKIIQRAEEMVGKEITYSVTHDNCEHLVNELRYGVSRSDQVTDMVAVVGVAAAFLVGFPSLGVAGLLGMALARRKRDKQ